MVVGLGNPGPKYEGTRHNVGFDVVDLLSAGTGWSTSGRFSFSETTLRSRPAYLVKPLTYMNDSGLAVSDALDQFRCRLDDAIILVDDINLDVGRTRVRRSGSEGGHNGLRSIIESVGSDQFARVRLGVGGVPSGCSQIEYVLGRFEQTEFGQVDEMILRAADAVRSWCGAGVEVAMNTFNRR